MLKPALRRLWRDPTTLQLGVDPRHAVMLHGLDIGDAGLLDLLDGTRDLAGISAEAHGLGHEPGRVASLVATLRDAAVLDDAALSETDRHASEIEPRQQPDLLSLSLLHRAPGAAAATLIARRCTSVDVLGAGRIGSALALLLGAAGVGRVEVSDAGPVRAADFTPGGVRGPGTRQTTRAAATQRLLAAPSVGPGNGVVVLAPVGSVLPVEWLSKVRHRPHLPVVLRETTAVIGPFVVPGQTACLRCLELTRGDRDPAWPVLAAQLVGEPQGIEPGDIALASAAAAIAALHVLAWLDRGETAPPPSLGGTVELSLADLRLRRRTVNPHPACGCGAIDAPTRACPAG